MGYWSMLKRDWPNVINYTGLNVQWFTQYQRMKMHEMRISWYIVDTFFYRHDFDSSMPVLDSLRPNDAYMRRWSNHHWFK